MRLIDADDMLNMVDLLNDRAYSKREIAAMINTRSTAYDIDKVVEEIEVNAKCVGVDYIDCPARYCWDCEENVINIKKAIKIVKELKEQKQKRIDRFKQKET